MGKRHAAAQSGIARAQADESVREAEARRQSAERERQLLTSYLGTEEQVAGTGRFNVSPDTLKYTQRYAVDERTLSEIQQAGQGIKRQANPFQSADNSTRGGQDLLTYGRGFANQANELLAQAEAAAQSGDLTRAEQLFAQAQQIISGVSPEAQGAYNLIQNEGSAAAIRASSAEGKIVGRQLLTAQQLGDSNSETSKALRGRLLDPALQAVDENTRNAERAIAAERSQIDGEIRQRGAGGGTGVNARAELDLKSRAASQSALQRATAYTEAGQQKAALTAQVNLYLNEFSTKLAQDSVALAQQWVNGTAGVRDIYQESLTQLDLIQADMANQWAQIFAAQAEARRKEDKVDKQVRREALFGFATGSLAVSTIFGGGQLGQTAGGVTSSTGVGAGGSSIQAAPDGTGGQQIMPEGSFMETGGGGGGGGGGLGALLAFL
jgi:hypothetical protein